MFRNLIRWPKSATGKDNLQVQDSQVQKPRVQGEADPAEPPLELDSVSGPLVVSPNTAKQLAFDEPDRSAEKATSILNELALSSPSRPSPKPSISGKRKHHEIDAVDDSSKKRVVKESRATRSRDQPPTTSSKIFTRQQGKSNRASSVTVKETPGKLRRPSREQRQLPMNRVSSAVQKTADEYDVGHAVEEQLENHAASLTTSTGRAPSSEAVPRRRGRPPRRQPSQATKKTSSNKEQRKATQDLRVKSRVGERIEGSPNPEEEVREGRQPSSEKSAQKAPPLASRPKNGADSTEGARKSKSRKSTTLRKERRRSPQPDEEEEKEEEGGQESGNGGDVVHPSNKDRQTSTFEEDEAGDAESDELDSEYEFEDSVNPSEEDQEKEEPELYGQDPAWKVILESTRSVYDLKLPLSTKIIQDLVHEVTEARHCYNELREPDGDSLDELNLRLRESLSRIKIQIESLSEETAGKKGSKMIRDIYGRAIPAMVFLLQSALRSRVYQSEGSCDLEILNKIVNRLKGIVDLQELAILLCEIAESWKVKPKGLVRRKLSLSLKAMHGAFRNILAEQQRKRKSKQNAVDFSKRDRELEQSFQRASPEAAKDVTKIIRESRERLDNKLHSGKPTYRQIIEAEARARMGSCHVDGHVESRATWTDEEDEELYYQLEKGYVGSLTCTSEKTPLMSRSCSLINHSCGAVYEYIEYASSTEQAS